MLFQMLIPSNNDSSEPETGGKWIHVQGGSLRLTREGSFGRDKLSGGRSDILWTDEIHFAPPKKPRDGQIPCKYQQLMVSHGSRGGANGFRPSTVGWLNPRVLASLWANPNKTPTRCVDGKVATLAGF